MDWPVGFPAEMSAGTVSVRSCDPVGAAELFEWLAPVRQLIFPADIPKLPRVDHPVRQSGATSVPSAGGTCRVTHSSHQSVNARCPGSDTVESCSLRV